MAKRVRSQASGRCVAKVWRDSSEGVQCLVQDVFGRTALRLNWSGRAVCLAAGFVFAARGRVVGLVDEDVVVARGTDHAVDRFGKLIVTGSHFRRVFGARLRSADGHEEIIAAPRGVAGVLRVPFTRKAARGETLLRSNARAALRNACRGARDTEWPRPYGRDASGPCRTKPLADAFAPRSDHR